MFRVFAVKISTGYIKKTPNPTTNKKPTNKKNPWKSDMHFEEEKEGVSWD